MISRSLKKYCFFYSFLFVFYFFQILYAYAENDTSFFTKVKKDYANFYSKDNFFSLGSAFLAGGICANTKIDENIKYEFQENLRSKQTDEVSKYIKILGDGKYIFPVVILAGSLSYMDRELVVSKWGGGNSQVLYYGAFTDGFYAASYRCFSSGRRYRQIVALEVLVG